MKGTLVENRYWLISLAQKIPAVKRLGIGLRITGWFALGWPLTAMPIFTWLLIVAATSLNAIAPYASAVAVKVPQVASSVHPKTLLISLVVLIGALSFFWFSGKISEVSSNAVLSVISALFFAANAYVLWVGSALLFVLLMAAAVVGAAFDFAANYLWPIVGLHRRWCAFRRELPNHWAEVAAVSPEIQSIDTNTERSVAEEGNRPILGHPAMKVLPDAYNLRTFSVEVQVARGTGRSLEQLQGALAPLSAQAFGVNNSRKKGGMELEIEAVGSSYGVMHIFFERPVFMPKLRHYLASRKQKPRLFEL